MRLLKLSVRDFRSYVAAEAVLGAGVTILVGPNGAGKTNLLEAVYFGCTGRSCRTNNERELLRFGAPAARVEVEVEDEAGHHELSVGFMPNQPKRIKVDGAGVERLLDAPQRPLMSVFLPDRLELVKGTPALRRAHLDQFIAALWPSRALTRRAFAQALAQRNALIAGMRAGRAASDHLIAWDRQLAHQAIALMADRAAAVAQLTEPFARLGELLGLASAEQLELAYRPRSRAQDAEAFTSELAERHQVDLHRGFTGHGPHRDDVVVLVGGRELRAFGSQGQQRLGLLALLLAEREAIATARGKLPVLLLDDVMSELDRERRRALMVLLQESPGQALITTTDADHVPSVDEPLEPQLVLTVGEGRVLAGALVP